MKNRYYRKGGIFVAMNENIDVMCDLTGDFSINRNSLGAEWHEENDYQEITRAEFMEAYLPIAEKMNNKIGEL